MLLLLLLCPSERESTSQYVHSLFVAGCGVRGKQSHTEPGDAEGATDARSHLQVRLVFLRFLKRIEKTRQCSTNNLCDFPGCSPKPAVARRREIRSFLLLFAPEFHHFSRDLATFSLSFSPPKHLSLIFIIISSSSSEAGAAAALATTSSSSFYYSLLFQL